VSIWCDDVFVAAFRIPLGWGGNSCAEVSAAVCSTQAAWMLHENRFTLEGCIQFLRPTAESRTAFERFLFLGIVDAYRCVPTFLRRTGVGAHRRKKEEHQNTRKP